MYVLRAGFLDGAAGVIVAALAAMSVAAKYARLWELCGESGTGNRESMGPEVVPIPDSRFPIPRDE